MGSANGSEFKIDKGIKPPPTAGGRNGKYPFASMKPGDSFLLATPEAGISARFAASQWGKRHGGLTFSVRKTDEGYRCWRIA